MTQEQCEDLDLERGSRVHVRPRRARTFAPASSGRDSSGGATAGSATSRV
jgi:hypothetical protein